MTSDTLPVHKPRKIAILTLVFRLGYGVGVVIETQARRLRALGHEVHIFTLFGDHRPFLEPDIPIWPLCRKPVALGAILRLSGFDTAIAHTHPFFRLLPSLKSFAHTIAYEHGCPPPELFADRETRSKELENMVEEVYSQVDAVVAISHFIRRQIAWPSSHVIYNGADHLASAISGEDPESRDPSRPIRILCVSRFGDAEIKAKGIDLLIQLRKDLPLESFEIHLVGRGTPENTRLLQQYGIRVFLNAPDHILDQEYRSCDALVSFSRWEGFNLPLVEAGFRGKAAYALDIGAHAEVTPFCFPDYHHLLDYLLKADRARLESDGVKTAEFVRRFSWDNNLSELQALLNQLDRPLRKPLHPGFGLLANALLLAHRSGDRLFNRLRTLKRFFIVQR